MNLSCLKLKPHKLFHHLDEVVKWKNKEYFAPIFVELSPTDICNQKCHFCYTEYMGHKKLEIPGVLLVKIFSDLGKAGVKSVMIQGTGEPLLHKSLADAILAGKQAGLDMALCTNGVLLSRDILEKILSALSWLRVSAIECNAELYAKSHGCSAAHFKQVINNLKAAVEIRNRDGLDTVIATHFIPFPYNAEYAVETAKMCKEIGVDYLLVKCANQSVHNPTHRWEKDTYIKYRKSFEEVAKLQNEQFLVSVRWDQFESQKDYGPFKKSYKSCYGMEFETMIDSDSRVYPCLNFWRNQRFCLGDLNEMSFQEIWKSEQRRRVLDDIYQKFDLNQCYFECKHHHINTTLWELANPPMHKNFL